MSTANKINGLPDIPPTGVDDALGPIRIETVTIYGKNLLKERLLYYSDQFYTTMCLIGARRWPICAGLGIVTESIRYS